MRGTPSAHVASPVAGIVLGRVAKVLLLAEACPFLSEELKGVWKCDGVRRIRAGELQSEMLALYREAENVCLVKIRI